MRQSAHGDGRSGEASLRSPTHRLTPSPSGRGRGRGPGSPVRGRPGPPRGVGGPRTRPFGLPGTHSPRGGLAFAVGAGPRSPNRIGSRGGYPRGPGGGHGRGRGRGRGGPSMVAGMIDGHTRARAAHAVVRRTASEGYSGAGYSRPGAGSPRFGLRSPQGRPSQGVVGAPPHGMHQYAQAPKMRLPPGRAKAPP
jgi:hypothetical protein